MSGAHVNPAVSLGVYLKEKKNENRDVLSKMMIGQFLGAIAGAIIAMNALASNSEAWRIANPNS